MTNKIVTQISDNNLFILGTLVQFEKKLWTRLYLRFECLLDTESVVEITKDGEDNFNFLLEKAKNGYFITRESTTYN